MSENTNPAEDISKMPFEQALKELETIVTKMEQGNVDLEQSITLYERGEALKKHCAKLLSDAEMKIEKIRVSADGTISGLDPIDQN